MNHRARCLIALMVALGAPLPAQTDTMARARLMVGCWNVSIGKYAPAPAERGADTVALFPPAIIQIDTTPGQGVFEHQRRGWLVRAASPMQAARWRGSVSLGPPDSLDISWLRGFVSLDARVQVARDTARGRITRWYDYGGPMPVAPFTLVRSPCP
jgi:hypothetical protein